MSAPYVTNLQCIVFDVMDRVFWSSETDTETKEAGMPLGTGCHAFCMASTYTTRTFVRVRNYAFTRSRPRPPKDDKRGKIWMSSQQTIVVPMKHWLLLPPALASNKVMLKGIPGGKWGW